MIIWHARCGRCPCRAIGVVTGDRRGKWDKVGQFRCGVPMRPPLLAAPRWPIACHGQVKTSCRPWCRVWASPVSAAGASASGT